MARRETDPESYITEYTLVYEDEGLIRHAASVVSRAPGSRHEARVSLSLSLSLSLSCSLSLSLSLYLSLSLARSLFLISFSLAMSTTSTPARLLWRQPAHFAGT